MISFFLAAGLIAAAIITILAFHILILPVKIAGRLRSSMSDMFFVRIRWGLLRVSVRISAAGFATLYLYSFRLKEFPLTGTEEEKKEPEEEKKEDDGRFEIKNIVPVFGEAFVILRQTNFDYLRVNVRAGLGDPCDTGFLFGMASALKGLLSGSGRFELNVLPVFETEAFEMDVEAGISIRRLYRLIVCIVRISGIMKCGRGDKSRKSAGSSAAI